MKNNFKICNNEVIIYIKYKDLIYECLIDKEDLDKVSSIKGTWHINKNRSGHIDGVRTKIQKNKIRKQYWIHNIIMNKKDENNVIDHINHNTLDNRKCNLREVTRKENGSNVNINTHGSVGIRNIILDKGKYRVRINRISFGRYNTLEEAIKVASEKRKEIFPLSNEICNVPTVTGTNTNTFIGLNDLKK